MKVKITYFKPSGKYYSEGYYDTDKTFFHAIVDEVYCKFSEGDNPGLVPFAVCVSQFISLVQIQDDKIGVPFIIPANDERFLAIAIKKLSVGSEIIRKRYRYDDVFSICDEEGD